MALINCPECNKQISDKATACPHCGNPIAEPPTNQQAPVQVKKFNIQKLFAVLLTIFSLIALMATASPYWIGPFIAGIVWFIIIRILKD